MVGFLREAIDRFAPTDECMAGTHQSRSRQLAVRFACLICGLAGGATVPQPNRCQVRLEECQGLIRKTWLASHRFLHDWNGLRVLLADYTSGDVCPHGWFAALSTGEFSGQKDMHRNRIRSLAVSVRVHEDERSRESSRVVNHGTGEGKND